MTSRASSRQQRRSSARPPFNYRAAGPARPRIAYAPLLIALAGVLTYWNALHAPFIWDDTHAIVANPSIRGLLSAFDPPAQTPVSTRLAANVSFAINYAVGGVDVFGYHAVNLAVHILAAFALYTVVRLTLRDRLGQTFRDVAEPLALVASSWWLVHPLTSEVINYVTQRTEALMALSLLTMLYAAIRALDERVRVRWSVLALAALVYGMGSKESMVIAPLVIVAYDRAFVFSRWRDAVAVRKGLYAGLALTLSFLVVLGLLLFEPVTDVGFSTDVHPWTYLLNQMRIIPRYFELVLVPWRLVFDYGVAQPLHVADVAWSAVPIVLAGLLTLVCLVRWPSAGFLGVVFWLALAPASSVVPVVTEVGAERRMYLPLAIGSVALFTLAWRVVRWRVSSLDPAAARRVMIGASVLAVAWIAALAVRTGFRNAEFNQPVSLWRTSVDRWPHGRARYSYAVELLEHGERAAGLAQLELGAADFPRARLALAEELTKADGDLTKAIHHFRLFIRGTVSPDETILARVELAQVLMRHGARAEAVEEWRGVLAIAPRQMDALTSLGDLMMEDGRYQDAAGYYEGVTRAAPLSGRGFLKLGLARTAAGQAHAGAESLQRAAALDPDSHLTQLVTASALLGLERVPEGETHARAAVQLDPNNAEGHSLLGMALASRGAIAEAIAQFQETLKLNPSHAQARAALADAERQLRASRR